MTETVINNDKLVVLNGCLTSRNVSEIQEDVEIALYDTTRLILNITDLEKLDISGVYMLLIVKKKAETFGKEILILNNHNEIVTKAIKNSGIKNIIDVI